ncbi:MAG TPA: hypothetical protein VFA32_10245, partial [Dehalococcoidia bacterium]|nr:hypothetical protein [Dehalococcoidia bacterium]
MPETPDFTMDIKYLRQWGLPEPFIERGVKGAVAVTQLADQVWEVAGIVDEGEKYGAYRVEASPEAQRYYCACLERRFGGQRNDVVCGHVVAVMLARRAGLVIPAGTTPVDRGLKDMAVADFGDLTILKPVDLCFDPDRFPEF